MNPDETTAIAESLDHAEACMDIAFNRAQTRLLTDGDIQILLDMPVKLLAAMKAMKAYAQRLAAQSDVQLGDEWGGI